MTAQIKHMVFVRHGESQHHVNGLTGGWTDTPLTPVGKQQIESAVRLLQKLELVFCPKQNIYLIVSFWLCPPSR